jgi:hypothetical protein
LGGWGKIKREILGFFPLSRYFTFSCQNLRIWKQRAT